MKPRTKFQKKCLDIFNGYIECPAEVKEWAVNHFCSSVVGFKGSSRKRKVSYCARCGHRTFITDEIENIGKYCCSNCKSKVDVCYKNYRKYSYDTTIHVFRVIDGIQFIFRYKMFVRQQKCRPQTEEFKIQSAYAFDSKRWIIIRKNNFIAERIAPFEVFRYVSYFDDMYRLYENHYPKNELIPILKYRGFDVEGKSPLWDMFYRFRRYNILVLFVKPEFICLELAFKRNDLAFVERFIDIWYRNLQSPVRARTLAKKVNQAYKIANRHHYVAEDWNLWIDMIELLDKAGKDIRNPKFICPSDLHAGHQFALDSLDNYNESRERKRRKEFFKNGPFDIYWQKEFNPDFNEETFPRLLREYGYAENELEKKIREKYGELNRPIVSLTLEDYFDPDTGDTIKHIGICIAYDELVEENGGLYHRLREEYRNLGIELSPDNVILNPEVIPDYQLYYGRSTLQKNNKVDEAAEFKRLKSRFNGLVFTDAELTLMTLDSEIKYIEESKAMHNCIGSLKSILR